MLSCPNPLFIVGAPRSGTTLLQYILRSHPNLSLPTGESHFIVPLYRTAAVYGDLREVANVYKVLKAMETQSAEFLYTDLHGLSFDSEKLAQEFVAEGRHTMREIISGLFEKNAAGEGKKRWGDKTPYYVLHLPLLLDWWPKAQFIPRKMAASDVALANPSFRSRRRGNTETLWLSPAYLCQTLKSFSPRWVPFPSSASSPVVSALWP